MNHKRWAVLMAVFLSAVLLVAGNALAGKAANPDNLTYPLYPGKKLGLAVTGNPAALHKVFIGFPAKPGAAEQTLVKGVGGKIKYTYHLVPAIAATLPEAAIDGLMRNPRVTHIEADIEVYAVDAELDNTWGVKRIGAGLLHDALNKGAGITVAVIDSGIDYNHPDLKANYAGGYDFVNKDPDPLDDNGHGTHVAGSIAALDNGSGVVGVAPEAHLYALKVLNASGNGSYSNIVAALQWCVNNNIEVTNNSYGSSGDPGATVKAAFDNAAAAGVLHVAAAGNSGKLSGRGDNVIYPARWDSLIAVAATDSSDNRASWSSTGPAVEVAAPGVSIRSTLLGGGYGTMSGTSMACPHVAGTAALVIAAGISDANGVRQRLQQTADDRGAVGRDTQYGFGLVDAAQAASSAPSNNPPAVTITSPANGATFDSGASITFTGTAIDDHDGDISAHLAWKSSIDGYLGTGGSISTNTLSNGDHTITASATDSDGKTGSSSVSITVGPPPPQPDTMTVSKITYSTGGGRKGDKHLYITVAVTDNLVGPVSGATVVIDLFRNGSLDSQSTGATGAAGTVTFTRLNAPAGTYTTAVTSVVKDGYTWDGKFPTDNSFTK